MGPWKDVKSRPALDAVVQKLTQVRNNDECCPYQTAIRDVRYYFISNTDVANHYYIRYDF
jgi:hypothetical protein